MRRAAILITSLVVLTFAGCDLYFDDDDRKSRPTGPGGGEPDAGCGSEPGHPDAGFWPDGGTWPDGGFWPDAGTWPDGGFTPDAGLDW